MRVAALIAAALLGSGFAIVSVEASLKDVSSEIFVRLADLTRPLDQQKGTKQSIDSLIQQSSTSRAYNGVSWSMVQTSKDPTAPLSGYQIVPSADQGPLRSSKKRDAPDSNAGNDVPLPEGQGDPSTFTPMNPSSIPLAVKSPYLSAWLPSGNSGAATPPNHAGNDGYLAGQWPTFWTSSYGADGEYRLGWSGYIRIDNTTYQWMGNGFGTILAAGKSARQVDLTYTATRSIFSFEADGVRFSVTFMTPVWADDYFRQSIPLSYMNFALDRSSAQGRSVQMYTDIDERWVTGHDYDYGTYPYTMQWVDNANGSSVYFVQRNNPEEFKEYRQRAEWGSAAYAMRKRSGMSSRNENNVRVQREFLTTGTVTLDHKPIGGPDNSFSYTVDFTSDGGDEALFAIGHLRMPYVSYIKPTNSSGLLSSYQQKRFGRWAATYPTFSDLVGFFLSDYENALSHSVAFDKQIDDDSRAAVGGGDVGAQYSAITQLSVRQSLAALEITVSYDDEKKAYDTDDTIIFLKEISSNGDMQTVDVFTPQFPLLSYLNPDMLRDVMNPIFEYTESGLYPNKWCAHDLGTYPTATGHNDGKDEPMQVEESGNMILLALHYAQLVGDKAATPWLSAHYAIMQQWAEFLISDSLIPALQLSTDDFAGTLANQTNLALKGIEGIAALGRIASLLGHGDDSKRYANVSQTYIQAYYGYAINSGNTHVKLAYQDDASWGTLYNLVFDRLLNLQLVAEEVYTKQDAFYPTKAETYGTPLDSRYAWAKSDWQMWASATAASTTARDYWIKNLYKFASDRTTDAPLTDLYNTRTGDFPKEPDTPRIFFIARPVVGGHFIHLAMQKANAANQVAEYAYGPAIEKIEAPDSTATADKTSSPQQMVKRHLRWRRAAVSSHSLHI